LPQLRLHQPHLAQRHIERFVGGGSGTVSPVQFDGQSPAGRRVAQLMGHRRAKPPQRAQPRVVQRRALMVGQVELLRQLGFSMGLGMLMDTYVIRPLLLPAFAALFRRTGKGHHLAG